MQAPLRLAFGLMTRVPTAGSAIRGDVGWGRERMAEELPFVQKFFEPVLYMDGYPA